MKAYSFNSLNALRNMEFGSHGMREMLILALNSMRNGSIIIDHKGIVVFISDNLARLLELDAAAQAGRHCEDVIPGSRLHMVAANGTPELDVPFTLAGAERIVRRIPLKRRGEVQGVLGLMILVRKRELLLLEKRLDRMRKQSETHGANEGDSGSEYGLRYSLRDFGGVGDASRKVREHALKAASTSLPVLLEGETGTGKEVIAQSIHVEGERRDAPFIRISCANIPGDLFEAELFGYEGGAYTGARAGGAQGKLSLASGGTVFFDEIGEMPLGMQAKLLNVLEEKSYYRLGGGERVQVDFRILCATNKRLIELVRASAFREDLYYRISTVPIYIPPLRERREDILPLARGITAGFGEEEGSAVSLSEEATLVLVRYAWPGNVRELLHCLEYAFTFREDGNAIRPASLPPYLLESEPPVQTGGPCAATEYPPLREEKEEAERESIRKALATSKGHKGKAAKLLGIHRSALYRKMAALGLR